jgi:cytochrome c oxidase subunit 2
MVWFQATGIDPMPDPPEPGVLAIFPFFCTEYCGSGHSRMIGEVWVVDPALWRGLIDKHGGCGPNEPPVDCGKKLFTMRACNVCHSIDGTKVVGPSFKGLWGREEEVYEGPPPHNAPKRITVDEAYLIESVKQPLAKTVGGYAYGLMPPQPNVTDDDIRFIIEYIKTLK